MPLFQPAPVDGDGNAAYGGAIGDIQRQGNGLVEFSPQFGERSAVAAMDTRSSNMLWASGSAAWNAFSPTRDRRGCNQTEERGGWMGNGVLGRVRMGRSETEGKPKTRSRHAPPSS